MTFQDDTKTRGKRVHEIVIEDIIKKDEWIWFLGFLWADGCVGDKSYSLEVKKTDFDEIWPTLSRIGFRKYRSRIRHQKYEQCSVSSSQGLKTFIYFDYRNKSSEPPTKLWNILNDDQKWLFLRGYLEGDGSYAMYGKRKDRRPKQITLNGPIDYDYSFIVNFFKENDITTNNIIRTTRSQHNKIRSYSIIAWTNQEIVYKIFKKLYNNNLEIGLTRKKDIALQYISDFESGKILLRERSIINKSLQTKRERLNNM